MKLLVEIFGTLVLRFDLMQLALLNHLLLSYAIHFT